MQIIMEIKKPNNEKYANKIIYPFQCNNKKRRYF